VLYNNVIKLILYLITFEYDSWSRNLTNIISLDKRLLYGNKNSALTVQKIYT